jgi:hypothetical protein
MSRLVRRDVLAKYKEGGAIVAVNLSAGDPLTRRLVAALLSLGYSNRMVANKTGVSIGQINYIAKRTGIKRKAYRDGESKVAAFVADKAMRSAVAYVQPLLIGE